ncbi:MAG TPA: ribosome maturation factor RimM [Rudaea sp.]|nr:ribosome maturation factor RimM [Rudaea sp.]
MRADRLVVLGKIVGLSGVRGAVKLESYTEPRARIFAYQPWLVRKDGAEIEISGVRGREQGKGMIATLPGVADRDAAMALMGAEIRVWRSKLPKPKRGEYYWTDLEDLEVVTQQGTPLGRVSHVFATGANDVLAVRDGERERLIPFVTGQFVLDVDLDAGRITVDWDPEF